MSNITGASTGPDKQDETPVTGSRLEVWQIWPGRQRFHFNGRIMLGPSSDKWYTTVAYAILVLLPLSEFILTAEYLWMHVTPAIPCVTIYLYIVSMILGVLITCSDPGIIPRRGIFTLMGKVPPEFSSDALLNLQLRKPRFCKTCEIYRPAHSHHCPRCDSCIENFDHHCIYLNNCIGGRNYYCFVALVVHMGFLGLNLIDNLLLFILYDEGPDNSNRSFLSIGENSAVISIIVVLGLFTLGITILVCMLCIFHLSLCCNGKTTKEQIQRRDKGSKKVCCVRKAQLFKRKQVVIMRNEGGGEEEACIIVEQSESELSV